MEARVVWGAPRIVTHLGTFDHPDWDGVASFLFRNGQTVDVRVRGCSYYESQVHVLTAVPVFIAWDGWIEDGAADFRVWRDNSPLGWISLVEDAAPFWAHEPNSGYPSSARKAATLDECVGRWFA